MSTIEATLVNMVLVFIPGTVWNRLGGKETTAVPCGFQTSVMFPLFLENLHSSKVF